VELRYRREATVGAFLIVAALVFAFGLMWLRGLRLSRGDTVDVVFADVVGLKVGDPIRTSGVAVGTVKSILLDRPGRVVVRLELTHKQEPRSDAKATVRSLDLFGARYIDFQPGTAAQALPAGRPLPGELESGFSEMAQGLATQGSAVLTNAAAIVGPENNRELRATVARAQRLLDELRGSVASGTREGVSTLQELRQTLQRIDLLVSDPAARQSLANVQSATANLAEISETLRHTTRAMDSIMAKVNSGRGTMGQLVNDTTLMAELRRTNGHLDSLLTDFMAHPKKYISLHVF
jgi:phospholipid/cholesterol/gamma-HCH transport system substrate-binding protein